VIDAPELKKYVLEYEYFHMVDVTKLAMHYKNLCGEWYLGVCCSQKNCRKCPNVVMPTKGLSFVEEILSFAFYQDYLHSYALIRPSFLGTIWDTTKQYLQYNFT
jgi:hypothetical protein